MTKEFGETVENYMKENGLSRKKVIHDSLIDPSYLHRIIEGTRNVSPETAIQLASALNVPEGKRAEFLMTAVGFDRSTILKTISALQPGSNQEYQ
jgi:transcriptional regulator with XRE-family HTH domain